MKRFLSLALCLCMIFSVLGTVLCIPVGAVSHVQETTYNGLDISSYVAKSKAYGGEYYQAAKRFDEIPRSFETWVYLSSSMRDATVGTVIGSCGKGGGGFGLGVTSDFYPEILFYNSSAAVANPTHKAVFKEAQLLPGSWTHLVVTVDEVVGELKCYVNGELRQTMSAADACATSGCDNGCAGIFRLEWASKYPMRLGGTNEPMNPKYFRGYIQDTALYSDVLSADEVKGNYENGVNADDENLICYYDIDAADKGKNIEDLSGNGYDLCYSKLWLTEEEMQVLREEKGFADEYAYSIAVIGDIQYMTKSNRADLTTMYQWIADNKEEKDIRYAIGLGDITDQCQMEEWLFVQEVFKIFEDAGLEYSVIRGNHDVATVGGISESSKPTAVPEMYDEVFAKNEFYVSQFEQYGGFYEEGSVINTYRTLSFDGDDWLLVNLDFQANSSVRAWANEVIASHPNHRTIIVTHEYIGGHATPSTYGKTLWNDVASKHANVELVLSGHVTYDTINVYQSKGDNGNTVTQMLIDPQYMDREMSGLGVVTMFYFREDGTTFDVEHYSTVKKRYLMNINQRTIDLRSESDYPEVAWDGVTSVMPQGEGTKENPYKISSAANLLWMAEAQLVKDENGVITPTELINPFKDKYFVQTCDINLYSKTLFSIGYCFASDSEGSVFGGNYDGCGYVIRNGKISNPLADGASSGLFGETLGARISNLSLKNITVEATQNTGILVGRANGEDTVNACKIYESCSFVFDGISGKINIGTFVGTAVGTEILDCESRADIKASSIEANAGLLVGLPSDGAVVYNSVSYGEILTASGNSGAFAGQISGSVSIFACKNETDLKDWNLEEGAHVHTSSAFVKAADYHTAECECGLVSQLPCVKSEHGYCKYCELAITGASITLGEKISINYLVSIKDKSITEGKTLSMKFTVNGKTVTVESYFERNGKLVFTLGGFMPHEIGNAIDAELILSNGDDASVIASKKGYSIKDNCIALLENNSEEVRAVANSLLEYATKAQVYLSYNTDSFAAGGVHLNTSDALPTEADKAILIGNKNESCVITKFYAGFDGSLKLRAELSIADIESAVITVNRSVYENEKLIALGEGKYAIEIEAFTPDTINSEIDICVIYDGKQTARLAFGVDSHLYSLIEDKLQIEDDKANYRPTTKTVNEEEYRLFLAAYRYGVAVTAYKALLLEVAK